MERQYHCLIYLVSRTVTIKRSVGIEYIDSNTVLIGILVPFRALMLTANGI
jgi:hypothetical protein